MGNGEQSQTAAEPVTKEAKESIERRFLYRSENIGQLASALSKAQGEFDKIPKSKEVRVSKGGVFKYSYKHSTLDDCYKATRKHLSKHGLSIIQPLRYHDGQIHMHTELLHETGEWTKGIYPLKADESGQKNAIQAMGSTQTYIQRYSYCGILAIAGEEDQDGNNGNEGKQGDQNNQGNQDKNKGKGKAKSNRDDRPISPKQGIARLMAVARESGWTEENVKSFILDACGVDSRKKLTNSQAQQTCEWMKKNPKKKDEPIDPAPTDDQLMNQDEQAEHTKAAEESAQAMEAGEK